MRGEQKGGVEIFVSSGESRVDRDCADAWLLPRREAMKTMRP